MSKVIIEIAGSEIDLAKGVGFGLNFAIDDVKKIESKNSNYSKTITLAGSKNNNKILGGLFDINADFTFFNPNIKTEARVIVDSSTVIDGFLQLKSIEKQTDTQLDGNLIVYKCTISSKTVDFMTDIKDKKLNELDFERFDHVLSYSNVFQSWSNTVKDVYVYPLMYKNSNYYKTEDFKPAIYHKAYLKRIAQEAGYSLSGSLMDVSTPEGLAYSKEIIPFGGDVPEISDSEYNRRLFRAGTNVTTSLESGIVTTTNYTGPTFGGFDLAPTHLTIFDNDSTGLNFDPNGHWDAVGQKYVIDKNGSYNIELSVAGNIVFDSNGIDAYQVTWDGSTTGTADFNEVYSFNLQYQLYKSDGVTFNPIGNKSNTGITVPYSTGLDKTFEAANGHSITQGFTSTIVVPNLSLKVNEEIKVFYSIEDSNSTTNKLRYVVNPFNEYPNQDVPVDFDITSFSSAATFIRNSTNAGGLTDDSDIILSEFIPKDVKQSDLIKDLVKRTGAYISTDPDNDRNVIIDTRDAYYAKGGLLDWSDKKDNSSKTDIKLLSELQNKEFLFTYKTDSDSYNENYTKSTSGDIFGQKSIEFDNEFVEGTKKIETPFSATPLIYNSGSPCAIVSAIETAEPQQNIRVLYYDGLIDCLGTGSWIFTSSTGGVEAKVSLTTYPYAGHLDNPITPTLDLNFGENPLSYYSEAENTTNANLYNRFWANYINQIDTGKLVTMSMDLNEVDISYIRHNLNAKIYIKDSYYYINKIVDYNPIVKGVTRVEFLKINEGIAFISKQPSKNDPSNFYEDLQGLPDYADPKDKNMNLSKGSTINGDSNSIGAESNTSAIYGYDNYIGKDSPNSVIYGNNNSIAEGVENGFIIGANNKEITESGTGWVGEIKYRNGVPENAAPYLVYSAFITQTGTAIPVATVIENTLETTLDFTRSAAGSYSAISAVALPTNTVCISDVNTLTKEVLKTQTFAASDLVKFRSYDAAGVGADNVLTGAYIEIRAYN